MMPKETSAFFLFIRHVISGDLDAVSKQLTVTPNLATATANVGASRAEAENFFFAEIRHYIYAGDTALHMAAAAFQSEMARLLIAHDADLNAKNRHGQQPLHYAADSNRWAPDAQVETIMYLLAAGADPNARDKSGVAPLHRAVRTRSAPAVLALLDGDADPKIRNKAGSTPLHLSVQNTGRSGSGSEHAHEQQSVIIKLLLKYGPSPNDKDGQGKSVIEAATSDRIRSILLTTD